MIILGISCYFHDSSASLLVNGKIVAASQEERYTRIKGDSSFPTYSIASCLDFADLSIRDVNCIVFYEDPYRCFKRYTLAYTPSFRHLSRSFSSLLKWSDLRLYLKERIHKKYPSFDGEIFFSSHHLSHASAAFYPSPFDSAAILTIDGVGEFETSSICRGVDSYIQPLKCLRFPHSLGLLYSAITTYLGFKANSGEYKVMGLAPYGRANYYYQLFKSELAKVNQDGSLELDQELFTFQGGTMYSPKLSHILGVPPRLNEQSPLVEPYLDIASGLQAFTEDVVVKMAIHARDLTGSSNLVMSGGVALNCVANGKLSRQKIFQNIWIQPASGDSGNSLGAALYHYHHVLGHRRDLSSSTDSMNHARLGPEFTRAEVKNFLDSVGAVYRYIDSDDQLAVEVSKLISEDNIVGIFRGRMEFGPRALGSRSILGNPTTQTTQTKMNLKIKFRESFRPFAPLILENYLTDWFGENAAGDQYMLFVDFLKSQYRLSHTSSVIKSERILDRLNVPRSSVPAVTHVDYSARIQTVSFEGNPFIFKILVDFNERTGVPILVNTSFNVRGEPIVCTPADAFNCLLSTYMDFLCIDNFLLRRSDQELPQMSPEAIQVINNLTD